MATIGELDNQELRKFVREERERGSKNFRRCGVLACLWILESNCSFDRGLFEIKEDIVVPLPNSREREAEFAIPAGCLKARAALKMGIALG